MEGKLNVQKIVEPNFDGPDNENKSRVIIIIEDAFLEVVKVKGKYQLLNYDDHQRILKKHNRDPTEARPDITHQTLLSLLDSPLNKSGLLQVFIKTKNNQVIKIDPTIRIPRTFKRFCGLMVEVLDKMVVKAVDSGKKLISIIKSPVESHLPKNIRIIKFSRTAPKMISIPKLVSEVTEGKVPPNSKPVCFVIGGIAHGHIDAKYATEAYSISEHPLSASAVASRICCAFENEWCVH